MSTVTVKIFDNAFMVQFTPEAEDQTLTQHFGKTCGWKPHEIRRLKGFDWFCARVDLVRVGTTAPMATQYLGACCYRTAAEFYTQHAGDYFADMVRECVAEATDLPDAVRTQVLAWCHSLRTADAPYTPGA